MKPDIQIQDIINSLTGQISVLSVELAKANATIAALNNHIESLPKLEDKEDGTGGT